MDASKFYIVIVDDTMRKDDPFVVELQLNYADVANIEFFSSVDKAMSFVEQHMSKRMIIFMDCKFGSVWQGVDAIKDLRKQTSLIYVVMMSANNVNQLDPSDIAALINMDNIFFIKNTNTCISFCFSLFNRRQFKAIFFQLAKILHYTSFNSKYSGFCALHT